LSKQGGTVGARLIVGANGGARVGSFIASCAREMKMTGRTDYDTFGCKNEFTDIVRSFAIAPIATLNLI